MTEDIGSEASLVFAGDFVADLREHLVLLLNTLGLRVDTRKTALDVCQIYFNVLGRRIAPQQREVVQSRELAARAMSPAVAAGLANITGTSLAGGDLLPFQSRELAHGGFGKALRARGGKPDPMLNAWGINHLHLGLPNAEALVEGLATGEVAFAWVNSDRLHLIDVRGHAFDDAELLEIVHSNWPELLASKRSDFEGVSVGDPAIATLRRSGVNWAIKMGDGTNYMPPGGGHMCNGYSPSAVRDADMLLSLAEQAQAWCLSHPLELRATFERSGAKVQNLSAKLVFNDGDLLVQHSETGASVRPVRP